MSDLKRITLALHPRYDRDGVEIVGVYVLTEERWVAGREIVTDGKVAWS